MESVSQTMVQAPQRHAAPERLGKYTVHGLVGKGAMGVVYKSFDPHIKRPVALKTIRRDLLEGDDDSNFASRFRNEAQAAGNLAHPGIVGVYEYGEEGEFAFIAMEFVEGSSLRQYYDQKVRFSVADSVSILSQLLDALHYAHERGVCHRDIKPGNIMIVSSGGKIKITDFGIARIESSTLTQVGAILGTPGFIAPEVYLGNEYDGRVDVFAAGVVGYQLLVGSTPFSGTPENIMYKTIYETPVAPSVAAKDPGLQRYDACILRALAKRPQDRYASAGEFRDALMKAHADPVSPAVSEETIILNPQPVQPLRPAQESSRPSPAASRAPAATGSAPPPPSMGSGTPSISTASLAEAGWDLDHLARIEKHMARFIGPMARVMVKRAAASSYDIPGLLHWLAENITSPADRAEFLRLGAVAGPPTLGRPTTVRPTAGGAADEATRGGPNSVQGPNSRFGPNSVMGPNSRFGPTTLNVPLTPSASDVAQAAQLLAAHLGPIASVMVKRAAAVPGVTRDKFFLGLASHLTNDKERAAFLAQFGMVG